MLAFRRPWASARPEIPAPIMRMGCVEVGGDIGKDRLGRESPLCVVRNEDGICEIRERREQIKV